MNGNLASIPDQETNEFLTSLSDGVHTWIGVQRTSPGASTFEWTDGSKWGYTNYADGYPNNSGGDQDNMGINFPGPGQWDDENGDDPKWASPYICQHNNIKTGDINFNSIVREYNSIGHPKETVFIV